MMVPIRSIRLLILSTLCALVGAVSAGSAAADDGATVVPDVTAAVTESINDVRAENGLRPLAVSASLGRAARAHGVSMGADGFFSHSSADGTSVRQRLLSYYPGDNPAKWSVGEVLYWQLGRASADDVTSAWLASPLHRADLLSPRWREMGVAVVYAENAPGTFGGNDVTLVVADFGARAS